VAAVTGTDKAARYAVFSAQAAGAVHQMWHEGASREAAEAEIRSRLGSVTDVTRVERMPLPSSVRPLLAFVRRLIARKAREIVDESWGGEHCGRDWPGWVGCTHAGVSA
jgi:hypothetical protein